MLYSTEVCTNLYWMGVPTLKRSQAHIYPFYRQNKFGK